MQFNGTLNAGYDLSYTYGTEAGKKFQLANVKDVNFRNHPDADMKAMLVEA